MFKVPLIKNGFGVTKSISPLDGTYYKNGVYILDLYNSIADTTSAMTDLV